VQPRGTSVRSDGPKVRCAPAPGLGIKSIAVRAVVSSLLALALAGVALSPAYAASTCPGGSFVGRTLAESLTPEQLDALVGYLSGEGGGSE